MKVTSKLTGILALLVVLVLAAETWVRARRELELYRAEAERMRWAAGWTCVPRVLDVGEDATHEWLVTAALPGLSAVDPHWIARPEIAVRAAGRDARDAASGSS